MKRCAKCLDEKDESEFRPKNLARPDVLRSRCCLCSNEDAKLYRQRQQVLKVCKKCQQSKPLHAFNKAKNRPRKDGYTARCKVCLAADAERHKRNPYIAGKPCGCHVQPMGHRWDCETLLCECGRRYETHQHKPEPCRLAQPKKVRKAKEKPESVEQSEVKLPDHMFERVCGGRE